MKKLLSLVLVALLLATVSFTFTSAANYSELPGGTNYIDTGDFYYENGCFIMEESITVKPSTTYTLSINDMAEPDEFSIIGTGGLEIEDVYAESNGDYAAITFDTLSATDTIGFISICYGSVPEYNDYYGTADIQLEEGTVATSRVEYIEPVSDEIAPIINGGTAVWLTNVDNPDSVATILSTLSATDDNDGAVSVTVHSDLYTGNEGTLGDYNVTFRATDSSDNYTELVTIVRVVDIVAPIINLNGSSTIYVEYGNTYSELGANVSDNYDTGLSAVITGSVNNSSLGNYNLNYDSIDSSGNIGTTVTRTVTVQDTIAPQISLTGASTIYIEFGDNYTEQGATWTDSFDGSGAATVSGSVNVGVLDTYSISYNITDSNGNTASTVTRTVIVRDTAAPVFSGSTSYTWNISDLMGMFDLLDLITANDLFDGNLTDDIEIITDTFTANREILGTYNVLLRVTDTSGNSSDYSITINVIDDIAPKFYTTATLFTLEYADSMTQQDIIDYFGG